MRIFITGAAGVVGRELSRELAARPEVTHLLLTDVATDSLAEIAGELDSARVQWQTLDVTDVEATSQLARGYDLVMNCCVFSLFDPVLRAAAASGVNYADLLSRPTEEHDELAQRSRIIAISGLGLSPGLSSLLALHGSRLLERTLSVDIAFASLRPIAPSRGLLDSILWELSPECEGREYYQDGEFVSVPAFSHAEATAFLDPVGTLETYVCPHPETRTLPRSIPGLQHAAVRATWEPSLMDQMRVLLEMGLLGTDPIDTEGQAIQPIRATRSILWDSQHGKSAPRWGIYLNVTVRGELNGRPASVRYRVGHPLDWGAAGTGRSTAIPAAAGAVRFTQAPKGGFGVRNAEECIDPDLVLHDIRARGEMTIEQTITTS